MFGNNTYYTVGNTSFLLLSISTLVSVIALFCTVEPAKAACQYEGKTYQTGDTVGPLICMPDGSMQPQ